MSSLKIINNIQPTSSISKALCLFRFPGFISSSFEDITRIQRFSVQSDSPGDIQIKIPHVWQKYLLQDENTLLASCRPWDFANTMRHQDLTLNSSRFHRLVQYHPGGGRVENMRPIASVAPDLILLSIPIDSTLTVPSGWAVTRLVLPWSRGDDFRLSLIWISARDRGNFPRESFCPIFALQMVLLTAALSKILLWTIFVGKRSHSVPGMVLICISRSYCRGKIFYLDCSHDVLCAEHVSQKMSLIAAFARDLHRCCWIGAFGYITTIKEDTRQLAWL